MKWIGSNISNRLIYDNEYYLDEDRIKNWISTKILTFCAFMLHISLRNASITFYLWCNAALSLTHNPFFSWKRKIEVVNANNQSCIHSWFFSSDIAQTTIKFVKFNRLFIFLIKLHLYTFAWILNCLCHMFWINKIYKF